MQAVVANLLHTRKDRVLLIAKHPQQQDDVVVQDIVRNADEPYIEKQLVQHVVALHTGLL